MKATKTVAIFVILFSIFMLIQNAQGKAIPLMHSLFTAPVKSAMGASSTSIGKFALAVVLFVIALSFLSPKNGFKLTLILVLGALLINAKNMGKDSVLSVLFNAQPMTTSKPGDASGSAPQTSPGT